MIQQYFDFITPQELDVIKKTIDEPRWKFGALSNVNSQDHPSKCNFWHLNIGENESFYCTDLFNKIKSTTGDDFKVDRIYMNGHQCASHGSIHTDSKFENARTFLIYCNEGWYPELGGHTHYVYGNNDIVSVAPIPYSAVYFPGSVPHFAAPISPTFRGLRVTLAYKLYKI
jgi:hypothetical protein